MTAVAHTITGPDHYLPFVAIGKIRGYSLKKTLTLTFFCGIGHIVSALMIAVAFGVLGVSAMRFKRLEQYAHEIAGGTIMACGAAILCGL